MNPTERATWIKEMKRLGRYNEDVSVLEEGQREHLVAKEMLQEVLDYPYDVIWPMTCYSYPKFGNPEVNLAFVVAAPPDAYGPFPTEDSR